MNWINPWTKNQTPQESPYGFSEHFLWIREGVTPQESNGDIHARCDPGVTAMYSDRMWQANPEGMRAARDSIKMLGAIDYATPEDMDKFLSAYAGKPVRACALAKGCNMGNGQPLYIFWWKDA